MVEPIPLLLYNSEALRRANMNTNTKIRGLVWLFLALIVVVSVGSASYSMQSTNLEGLQVFEGKTEAQVGLEFLEIYSFQYEERPIISEIRADYSFDVHRSNLNQKTNDTNLYVVFKDLAVTVINGEKVPDIGVIDVFVYCSTDDNPYETLISFERLGAIPGTNVFANFLTLPTVQVDNCGSNQFNFVADIPQLVVEGAEPNEDIQVIEFISLSDLYSPKDVSTGGLLAQVVSLNDGFSGDLTRSSYNSISLQRAFMNAALSVFLVVPLAFGLWYATEKELFDSTITLQKKQPSKKKNGK
jgi:hypothetical protein